MCSGMLLGMNLTGEMCVLLKREITKFETEIQSDFNDYGAATDGVLGQESNH